MPENKFIICIDPGHGGSDPGAVGPTGVQEKIVTLAIVQKVASLLGDAGCTVVLTRANDVDVSLDDRADTANTGNVDAFVSVHCNAAAISAARGLEAFYFRQSGAGKRLADAILDMLVLETGLESRGVKESGLAVLRKTDMPAALVECGFLSNSTEEALLETKTFQQKCARAIASGILAFLGIEKDGLDNILPWARKSVDNAVKIQLVANPELLNESEQKILCWLDRLGLLERKEIADV